MSQILIPESGPGAELREYIERTLNLPPQLVSFTLRFAKGEAITCVCDFYPHERQSGENHVDQ